MERLEAAMAKARAARKGAGEAADKAAGSATGSQAVAAPVAEAEGAKDRAALWSALHEISISDKVARQRRLSALLGADQAAPYDILRTRVLRQMKAEGWDRLAITSPNKACGKSTVSLNLALSMARQAELRVVLLDFDLRRPSLAGMLNQQDGAHDLSALLSGHRDFADHAVRFGPNLALVLNRRPVPNPAETLNAPATKALLDAVEERYAPDVMIFDTPPMLGNDDNLAFLGLVDCAVLVTAADSTSAVQADTAERDLAGVTNVIGTVMNKCRYLDQQDGYYGSY